MSNKLVQHYISNIIFQHEIQLTKDKDFNGFISFPYLHLQHQCLVCLLSTAVHQLGTNKATLTGYIMCGWCFKCFYCLLWYFTTCPIIRCDYCYQWWLCLVYVLIVPLRPTICCDYCFQCLFCLVHFLILPPHNNGKTPMSVLSSVYSNTSST